MARATVAALLCAVLGLSVALSVNAAVFEGSTSGSGLIYLGKFVFEYNSPGDGPSGKWAATVETTSSGAVFGACLHESAMCGRSVAPSLSPPVSVLACCSDV